MNATQAQGRVMQLLVEKADAERDAALFLREEAQIKRDIAALQANEWGRHFRKGKRGGGG